MLQKKIQTEENPENNEHSLSEVLDRIKQMSVQKVFDKINDALVEINEVKPGEPLENFGKMPQSAKRLIKSYSNIL